MKIRIIKGYYSQHLIDSITEEANDVSIEVKIVNTVNCCKCTKKTVVFEILSKHNSDFQKILDNVERENCT